MENFFIGIIALFLGGLVSLFIKKQDYKIKFVSFMTFIASCFCIFDAIKVFISGKLSEILSIGVMFQNVVISMDYLSAFFVAVISVMSLLSVIYANGYCKSLYLCSKTDGR